MNFICLWCTWGQNILLQNLANQNPVDIPIWSLETHFSVSLMTTQKFHSMYMYLKVLAAKCWPFCSGINLTNLLMLWNHPFFYKTLNCPDSKVHGANMGPIWGRQDPGGPHVGPVNFAIWVCTSSRVLSSHILIPTSLILPVCLLLQVPFGTMVALLCMWFGISLPLVFLGYYFGYRKLVSNQAMFEVVT